MPRLYPPGIRKLLRVMRVDRIGNENGFKELAEYRGFNDRGALHFAAEAGLTDACKYLVEGLKLDVNTRDGFGFTPLTFAFMEGHNSISKYLLEHGAAIQNETSALHYAAKNGDFEVMKFLLDKGVSVDLVTDGTRTTPLAWAACKSQEDVVKFLLEHGAHPDGQPRAYYTPLQAAVIGGSFACSKLLIQVGADVKLVVNGLSALHFAASGGIVEIINLLLRAGANPDAATVFIYQDAIRRPRKPIEVAAARGHKEAVEILFPITEPIDTIKEWSVDGILGELQPENGRKKDRKRGQPKSRV